jgi:hypothetical protein
VALHMAVPSTVVLRILGERKRKNVIVFSRQRCKFMKLIFSSFLHSSYSSHKLKLTVKNLLYISEKRKNSYKFENVGEIITRADEFFPAEVYSMALFIVDIKKKFLFSR